MNRGSTVAGASEQPGIGPQELFLVDLAQWLSRRTQYAATHPSCAKLGANVHASLGRALAVASPLVYAILKDGVLMGDVPATHRAVLTRVAPHLHARGAQVVRFSAGATLEDLTAFIEVLTLSVQTAFDRGGLVRLLHERGVSHIHVDEIAHDIDPNERAEQRRRKEVREIFAETLRDLRAGRTVRGLAGEELLALLDDPATAVLILEEDPSGVTDAVAGLCYLVQKEEARSARVLFPKLRVILMMLSPASHAAVLVGFPPLLGNFRSALAWAFDRLGEEDLASFVVPALRVHVDDVDAALYALSSAVPHDGTRWSVLRLVGLRLHDLLPADLDLVNALARPIDDYDSFRRERACLAPEAIRSVAIKKMLAAGQQQQAGSSIELPPIDTRRLMRDLVVATSRRPAFERTCERLPAVSERLSGRDAHDAALGVLQGLCDVGEASRDVADVTLKKIASTSVCGRLLDDLDRTAASLAADDVVKLAPTVALLVKMNATEVWTRLERSDSLPMQHLLVEALPAAGPSLLPLLRSKIRTASPNVVRHVVTLLPRVGGTTRDLALVARYPNEMVRSEVIRALRLLHPDETTMDILVSYLEDASQELRTTARSMLRAELLSPNAIATLERIADDPNREEPIRKRSVEVLGRSPRDLAAEALFRLLQPRSLLELGTLRESAAVALRHSPAPKAAELFRQGISSSVRRVRKACERAERGSA